MASSKTQASKSSDKRKREKADQDESSNKKKRKHGKALKEDTANTPSKTQHVDPKVASSTPSKDKLQASAQKDTFRKPKPLQKWRLSEPMGGRMTDVDPIFSPDEKYVLLHFSLLGSAPC